MSWRTEKFKSFSQREKNILPTHMYGCATRIYMPFKLGFDSFLLDKDFLFVLGFT